MPTSTLAPAIARWLSPEGASCGEVRIAVTGDTVRQVLDAVFAQHPVLRGYVVDERADSIHDRRQEAVMRNRTHEFLEHHLGC